MKFRVYSIHQYVCMLFLLFSLSSPLFILAQSFPVALNPQTYTSPTGLYSCEVDPTDIYGRGPGNYLFKKNGRKVWSGKHLFTLYSAQIMDDGTIGGYAYSFGLEGMSEEGFKKGYGDLLIVIMRPNGTIVLQEAIQRQFSGIIHGNPQPSASLALASLGRDVLQVRLHYDSHQEWRTYRLSTGKRVEKDEPFGDDLRTQSLLSAKPVPSTPLILTHNWTYLNDDLGARFNLWDGSKHSVWELNLRRDYHLPDNQPMEAYLRRKIHEKGAILDVSKPNQFSIYAAATAEKVTFQVKADPAESGKWIVKEIGRQPFPDFLKNNSPVTTFADKPLRLLGTTGLQVPASLSRIVAAATDQTGRTYLNDYQDGTTYVFSLEGQFIFNCLPSKTDVSGVPSWPRLSVGFKGDVYFQTDDMQPIIHFAENGSRLGLVKPKVDFTQQYHPLPNNGQALILGFEKAAIVDSNNEPLVTITRQPDRKWLESPHSASIAPDGSFAIGTDSSYNNKPWHIHLYDKKGRPIRTIRIPEGLHNSTFAYSGKYVAALSPTHIHLWSKKGEPLLKSPLPEPKLNPDLLTLSSTKKGRELWLISHVSRTVYRYALP